MRHLIDGEDGEHDGDHLQGLEYQVHGTAEQAPDQHQHRPDEQCDLQTAADGDAEAEVHLVLRRHQDGSGVLRGIADDRHDDDADEQLVQVHGMRGVLDRPDQQFAHPSHQHCRPGQQADRLAQRPRLRQALFVDPLGGLASE